MRYDTGRPRAVIRFRISQPRTASLLSVSNSLSGRHWELDQVPAVGDLTDIVQLGTGHHVSAGEGQRRVALQRRVGLDPVSWTLSERWRRCPKWDHAQREDAHAGSSVRSSGIGAVRLVLDEGKTVGAVACELDLTPSALAQWVKQARVDRTKGKAGLTTEDRAELGCCCTNRDWPARCPPTGSSPADAV